MLIADRRYAPYHPPAMVGHPRAAPPRRERVEPEEPLHRLGRRRPDRQGRGRGPARRRAARRPRPPPRRPAHVAAAAGDPHRPARPRAPPTASWIPVRRSWRLNERHYGALQGKDKAQTLAEFGEEQFMLWRRSYDVPPPPLPIDDEFSQFHDPRYADPAAGGPAAHRVPRRRRRPHAAVLVRRHRPRPPAPGSTVLVAAHGNSLRALIKHLDDMDRGRRRRAQRADRASRCATTSTTTSDR